ncbi:MAG TPA: 2-phospho-L-lactate guanylyltransferase [Actinomycetota bacterium]|nr:2-phospho-L-lactate guanylyltransferase [Actinomycetota bacterium]
MRIVAVPVKSLSRAKTRLATDLTALERGALTLAMLEDVLDAVLAVTGWETWVVSPDEVALEIAARRGARAVPEDKPPLASAIRQVEALAKQAEASALAIVPADLPLVTAETLGEALHTLGAVVLAPSADGAGTSLLLRRPPRAIPARFGPDSFRRHLELANERGLPVSVVERLELSFDVDRPDDILTLLAEGRDGRTREVCLDMDLGSRIRAHA